MAPTVRAVPITSREDALSLLSDIRDYPNSEEKQEFTKTFDGTIEHWYYQEIEGKPYMIAVSEGGKLDQGHSLYKESKMPFFAWFRDRVSKLSNVDLRANPRGADSEYLGYMEP